LKPELKGRVAQIRTGEGKSTVSTLLALVLALRGETVDIITSTGYLALRDAIKY
jgi:preprotein translocase subunit SecA